MILPLVDLRALSAYWLVATDGVALRYIGFARDVVSLLAYDIRFIQLQVSGNF